MTDAREKAVEWAFNIQDSATRLNPSFVGSSKDIENELSILDNADAKPFIDGVLNCDPAWCKSALKLAKDSYYKNAISAEEDYKDEFEANLEKIKKMHKPAMEAITGPLLEAANIYLEEWDETYNLILKARHQVEEGISILEEYVNNNLWKQ